MPGILSHRYDSNDFDDVLRKVLLNYKKLIHHRPMDEALGLILSTHNYIERSHWKHHPFMNVSVGDICFIDFGSAYQLEAGYQHFGLVVSLSYGKLFVIPMSSNPHVYEQAYDQKENPEGKSHLLRFKKSCGLNRNSSFFLNDAKFISSARVIDVLGHLDQYDDRFKEIQFQLFKTVFNS